MDKKKILIIRLSALGDTIHTLPLASAIKRACPACQIGWIVEDKAQQFIQDNPIIDNCYILPRKQWKKRGFSLKNILEFFNIISQIRKEKYDIVIDTQQLFKSSVLMFFLNIKRKITHQDGREFSWIFANEFVKSDRKQFDVNFHVVKRNLEFAAYLGLDSQVIDFALPEVSVSSKEKVKGMLSVLDNDKPIVVLSPATTWGNKHWDEKYWAEIVKEFSDKVNLVMTGSSQDLWLINSILSLAGVSNVLNLAGKTNLLELSEVFRNSDVVLSPDSGSAHIAWATKVPSVITIFCATSKNRTGPFGQKYYSLGPDLDCAPCMKKKCHLITDKNKCRTAILPEQIINLLNNILHLA